MKACLVIPTYNEIDNITPLFKKILEEFKDIKDFDMEILIVDDNSPDKTWEIVNEFHEKHPNINLTSLCPKIALTINSKIKQLYIKLIKFISRYNI